MNDYYFVDSQIVDLVQQGDLDSATLMLREYSDVLSFADREKYTKLIEDARVAEAEYTS